MTKIRMTLAATAAALLALSGAAQAQSNTDGRTSQSEMQRGVPGVDVDVGRNAKGAVDVDVNRNARSERDRGVPGVDVDVGRNAKGAVDVNTGSTRAPRADRN